MSTRKPRISIGLPVYNGDRFLRQTLDSLLTQSYPDFELIISDNASTDCTEAICRAYVANDRRIRYCRNKTNLGASNNYRQVFELSTGEYFKWAAADDLCEREYLTRCVDVLNADPTIVLTHTKAKFIDEFDRVLDVSDPGWDLRSPDAAERLRYVIHAGHWVNIIFGLIRADALVRTRLVGNYPGGDYRLLGDLAILGRFVELPEYLFLRRLQPGASSQNTHSRQWQAAFYTGNSHHLVMPTWRRSLDHFATVIRSALRLRAKLSLVGSLLRRMHSQRGELMEELKLVSKRYLFIPWISPWPKP